jgi:ABC-type molybdate transport system substrate-binding protein
MRKRVVRIALAGHLMLFAPCATAQDYRGRVQGTVLDSTQSALPGATITTFAAASTT